MKPVRVVLVDDHCMVRQSLRSILEADPRFKVVGEAADGAEALRVVAAQHPTVVLLDLKLPDMSGIEVCRRIVQCEPKAAVLILTAFIERELVNDCLRAGASGYLLKDAEDLHLPDQLLAAAEGHTVLDPRAAQVLADGRYEHVAEELDQREIEILRLIAQGLNSQEIGARIGLDPQTIKRYIQQLLAKMGASHRIEAVLLAKEQGLI